MEIIKTLSIPLLIVFYYYFVKKTMINFARSLVKRKFFHVSYPLEELKGVIELVLIVLSHLIFAFFFAKFLGISLSKAMQFSRLSIASVILGGLLGIGQMAFSTTLCFLSLSVLQKFAPRHVPATIEEWVVQSRAGWIRHHFDAMKRLPTLLAVVLISLQITAEETVFRGVILNYFASFSPFFAILISTSFFILIQAFLMPRKLSSMFPVIGAVVIGISNGIIYYKIPYLIPLIISHAVFFFFSLI